MRMPPCSLPPSGAVRAPGFENTKERKRDRDRKGRIQVKTDRLGFTVLELLVVVAIIGILAGILLPVLGSARKRAMITVCRGQLVQFSQKIEMYRISWEEEYPSYLSNMLDSKDAAESTPKHYVCPLDWTKGEDGGVPDKVRGSSTSFMQGSQYAETDDTASNATYKTWRNQVVTHCSYLYEFCGAPCSWAGTGESWAEVKKRQMVEGDDGKYAGGHVPIVRCFWHAKQRKDGSGYVKGKPVLNVAVADRNVFDSSPRWEDDL
jgi:prepilin-type N-terminal cleavage/methylation domain-containing protein